MHAQWRYLDLEMGMSPSPKYVLYLSVSWVSIHKVVITSGCSGLTTLNTDPQVMPYTILYEKHQDAIFC